MNDALKILLVDNDPDSRALAMREIEREFPYAEFHPVNNAADLVRAVEHGPWDLVMTDHRLGWSDGISVMLSVKARDSDCPVIMFTASGGEDVAVLAMKAGLDDYVSKPAQGAGRLLAAVHMALERARQHRDYEHAVSRYRGFFDDVPLGLFSVDREGQIIEANTAVAELLHYPGMEALLAGNLFDLVIDGKRRMELRAALRRSPVVKRFAALLKGCDGQSVPVAINLRATHRLRSREILYYEGSLEAIIQGKAGKRPQSAGLERRRGAAFTVPR